MWFFPVFASTSCKEGDQCGDLSRENIFIGRAAQRWEEIKRRGKLPIPSVSGGLQGFFSTWTSLLKSFDNGVI